MMQLFTKIEAFKTAPGQFLSLTLGNFDGLHLGHQKILKRVIQLARQTGFQASVLTFQEHPQRVLNPNLSPPAMIMTLEHKLSILNQIGIDLCFLTSFTEAFSKIEADVFVRDILLSRLGVKTVSLGYNAHFGHARKGSPSLMRKLSRELSFEFEEIGPVELGGEAVSSSRVRKLIQAGDMDQATACLGRPFSFLGKVVRGDGRGKAIGFPTANLELSSEVVLPPQGVYPVRVREIHIQKHPIAPGQEQFEAGFSEILREGVLNYGIRPTFKGASPKPVLEVFLMNFQGDLYGKTLEIFFYPRLRAEKAFSGAEALKTQIIKDVADAGRYFASAKAEIEA